MDDLYIKKVLEGDTDVFRYFVGQYKDMAFSLSMSVVKDEFLATDVVQESFMKAFQNLKKCVIRIKESASAAHAS